MVETGHSIAGFLDLAIQVAHEREAELADDAEGATLSSRPPSPLSDLTSSEEDDSAAQTTIELGPSPSRPSTLPLPAAVPGIEKQRRKIAAAKRRKARRTKVATTSPNAAHSYRLKASNIQQYRERATKSIKFELKSLAAYAASTAWVGKRMPGTNQTTWTLDEVLARGFRLIKWDGMSVKSNSRSKPSDMLLIDSNPMLLVDDETNIVVILAGRPDDPNWDSVIAEGVRVMEEVRRAGHRGGVWKPADVSGRRGDFVAVASGVSFGGGQRVRVPWVIIFVLSM